MVWKIETLNGSYIMENIFFCFRGANVAGLVVVTAR